MEEHRPLHPGTAAIFHQYYQCNNQQCYFKGHCSSRISADRAVGLWWLYQYQGLSHLLGHSHYRTIPTSDSNSCNYTSNATLYYISKCFDGKTLANIIPPVNAVACPRTISKRAGVLPSLRRDEKVCGRCLSDLLRPCWLVVSPFVLLLGLTSVMLPSAEFNYGSGL